MLAKKGRERYNTHPPLEQHILQDGSGVTGLFFFSSLSHTLSVSLSSGKEAKGRPGEKTQERMEKQREKV